jgi:phenylalanine-4-hydroxylase
MGLVLIVALWLQARINHFAANFAHNADKLYLKDPAVLKRVEYQQSDRGEVPIYADGIVQQDWDSYSVTDHQVWQQLFKRQSELLPGRACEEFLEGLCDLKLGPDLIPRFDETNLILKAKTGWELVAVEGLLPDLRFFELLAAKQFPVTWWIRRPDQIDYISEPDLFHDFFGHVPLLANPVFGDYLQAYGAGGVKAAGLDALGYLARLYWYTVEFGLIQTPAGLRIYGAGILSSKGESIYALDSDASNRIGFDLMRVMQTRYRIDSYQQSYFVIENFKQLFDATAPDFTAYYQQLKTMPTLAAADVMETDHILQRGTRAGFLQSDDV